METVGKDRSPKSRALSLFTRPDLHPEVRASICTETMLRVSALATGLLAFAIMFVVSDLVVPAFQSERFLVIADVAAAVAAAFFTGFFRWLIRNRPSCNDRLKRWAVRSFAIAILVWTATISGHLQSPNTVSVGLILVATVFHLGPVELAVCFAFTSAFTILVTPFIVGPALESALNVSVIAGTCVVAYSVGLILRSSRERAADALFQVKTVLAGQEQTVADRTAELHDALREREALLREIHHRTKNSLQMLAGLVHLSISDGSTKEPQQVLMTTDFRVSCLSFLYNNVYALPNVGSVTLDQYLTDLTAFFQRSVVTSKPDTVTIAVGNNTADVDKAVGLGMILCETFLVASEYATDDNTTTKITVSSDGGKLDVNLTGTGTSPKALDTLLVEGLVEQYEGTGSITFDKDGTLDCCFSIPAHMI